MTMPWQYHWTMKHRWMKHLHGLTKTSTLEQSQAMPQETKRNKKHPGHGTHKKHTVKWRMLKDHTKACPVLISLNLSEIIESHATSCNFFLFDLGFSCQGIPPELKLQTTHIRLACNRQPVVSRSVARRQSINRLAAGTSITSFRTVKHVGLLDFVVVCSDNANFWF